MLIIIFVSKELSAVDYRHKTKIWLEKHSRVKISNLLAKRTTFELVPVSNQPSMLRESFAVRPKSRGQSARTCSACFASLGRSIRAREKFAFWYFLEKKVKLTSLRNGRVGAAVSDVGDSSLASFLICGIFVWLAYDRCISQLWI